MSDPADLTEERLARALRVYAVTGPGWFIAELIAEIRRLRRVCEEQAERIAELEVAVTPQVKHLRAALEKYGQHDFECDRVLAVSGNIDPARDCTCGFCEALATGNE